MGEMRYWFCEHCDYRWALDSHEEPAMCPKGGWPYVDFDETEGESEEAKQSVEPDRKPRDDGRA